MISELVLLSDDAVFFPFFDQNTPYRLLFTTATIVRFLLATTPNTTPSAAFRFAAAFCRAGELKAAVLRTCSDKRRSTLHITHACLKTAAGAAPTAHPPCLHIAAVLSLAGSGHSTRQNTKDCAFFLPAPTNDNRRHQACGH